MNKLIGLALVVMFILAGCGEEEEISQSYYVAHEVERNDKLKYCEENLDKQLELNCINAQNARAEIAKKLMKTNGIKVDYSSVELEHAKETQNKEQLENFYLENEVERSEKLKYCNAPENAAKKYAPDCFAALKAETKITKKRMGIM